MEMQFHYKTSCSEKRNILPLKRVVTHLSCRKDRNFGLPLGLTEIQFNAVVTTPERLNKICKVTVARGFVLPYKVIFSITGIVIAM